MMKRLLASSAILFSLVAAVQAGTLDEVKARGTLKCGVNPGLSGFAAPDTSGQWQGFDVL